MSSLLPSGKRLLTSAVCSALVGFAAMIATLPLPGYVTKHIQGAQREKMKRVSSSFSS